MDDIYLHTPELRYLRLNGNYYTWKVGLGWSPSEQDKMPDLALFRPLAEPQKETFVKGLKEQGLIE